MFEHASQRWLWLAADSTARGLVLLAVAWGAASAMRRGPAAHRHLVYLAGLAGILALPALSGAIPRWSIALPGMAPRALRSPAPSPPMRPAPRASVAPSFAYALASRAASHRPSGRALEVDRMGGLDARPAVLDAGLIPGDGSRRSAAPQAAIRRGWGVSLAPPAPWRWPEVLFAFWGAGALCMLARGAVARRRLRRVVSRSLPAPAGLADAAAALARDLGVSRPVRVLLAPGDEPAVVPATWGIVRPGVLLPIEARDWPNDRVRAVLLHELAHARRADWAVEVVVRATCAIYWFHPLVWATARRLRAEAERACDDGVLMRGVDAAEYAGHLLEVVKMVRSRQVKPLDAVAIVSRTSMEERVRAVLDGKRVRRPATARACAVALIAGACVLLPLSAVQVVSAATAAARSTDRRAAAAVTPPAGLDAALTPTADPIAAELRAQLADVDRRIAALRTRYPAGHIRVKQVVATRDALAARLREASDDRAAENRRRPEITAVVNHLWEVSRQLEVARKDAVHDESLYRAGQLTRSALDEETARRDQLVSQQRALTAEWNRLERGRSASGGAARRERRDLQRAALQAQVEQARIAERAADTDLQRAEIQYRAGTAGAEEVEQARTHREQLGLQLRALDQQLSALDAHPESDLSDPRVRREVDRANLASRAQELALSRRAADDAARRAEQQYRAGVLTQEQLDAAQGQRDRIGLQLRLLDQQRAVLAAHPGADLSDPRVRGEVDRLNLTTRMQELDLARQEAARAVQRAEQQYRAGVMTLEQLDSTKLQQAQIDLHRRAVAQELDAVRNPRAESAGADPARIEAEAKLQELDLARQQADRSLQRIEARYRAGAVPMSELDAAKQHRDQIEAERRSADAVLQARRRAVAGAASGGGVQEIEGLEDRLARAKSLRADAMASLEHVRALRSAGAAAQAEVDSAKERVDRAQAEIVAVRNRLAELYGSRAQR